MHQNKQKLHQKSQRIFDLATKPQWSIFKVRTGKFFGSEFIHQVHGRVTQKINELSWKFFFLLPDDAQNAQKVNSKVINTWKCNFIRLTPKRESLQIASRFKNGGMSLITVNSKCQLKTKPILSTDKENWTNFVTEKL